MSSGLARINWRRVYGAPSSRKTITCAITVTAIRSWGIGATWSGRLGDAPARTEITKVVQDGKSDNCGNNSRRKAGL
jgi:hypothetical protein